MKYLTAGNRFYKAKCQVPQPQYEQALTSLSYMIETAYKPTSTSQLPKEPGPSEPRWNKPSTAIFAILFAVLLFYLMPAGIFDLLHIGGQECSKPDVITGFVHLPNKHVTWTLEGFSQDTTNAIGFVDGNHQVAKPPGVWRIAVLGDSMVEALQVPQGKRFSNLLEQQLNAQHPGKFEVMNFGISAASTGQEYLIFLRYVEQYKPDVTILFFDDGDDDKNIRKPLLAVWHPHVVFGLQNGALTASWRDFDSWLHSAQAMPIALFEQNRANSLQWEALIQGFDRLKTDAAFTDSCAFLNKIKLLNPIEDVLTTLFPVSSFGSTEFRLPQAAINDERKTFCSEHGIVFADNPVLSVPRFNERDYEYGTEAIYHTRELSAEQYEYVHQRERERWNVTLAILQHFSNECKQVGSKFVVLSFPTMKSKEGFAYAFKHVEPLADQKNTYVKELTPVFDNGCRSQKDPPRLVCHLSATGHEVLTKVLSDYLVQNKIISK
jgi:hypothetical protein